MCNNKVELDKRINIGLTGSFGRGNYGDELYLKNYQYWFNSFANIYLLTGLPKAPYLQDFNKTLVDSMDAICLGGGDLLVPFRYPIDRDFTNPLYLRRPLYVSCIGVQRTSKEDDPRVIEQWREFLTNKNIKMVATRDTGSKEWISENIDSSLEIETHPDMVCALPLPEVNKERKEKVLGIVTRHVANKEKYKQLEVIGQHFIDKGWQVHHIIGGVGAHGKNDFENAKGLEIPGKKVIYTEDLDEISKSLGECSLVLSFKLHTTIVSVMYGVPTVCVNPVVKAKAFMASAGLSDLVFSPNDPKLLELLKQETPRAPDVSKIEKLKKDASDYMENLGNLLIQRYSRQPNCKNKLEIRKILKKTLRSIEERL